MKLQSCSDLMIEEVREEGVLFLHRPCPDQFGKAEPVLQPLGVQHGDDVRNVVRGEEGEREGVWSDNRSTTRSESKNQ